MTRANLLIATSQNNHAMNMAVEQTARRLLRGLVDEGLAWPLPPSRAAQPGRPRQFYRLITEKLEELEPSRAPT